jgi:hypothetical protein
MRNWVPGVVKHVECIGTRATGQGKLSKTSLSLAKRLEQREVHSIALAFIFLSEYEL